MKLRIKSVIWTKRKQKTPNQNRKKKKEFKKNEDSVRSLRTTSNIPTFVMGGGGRRRERGIENLFEKIMTENLPNLEKEIDI